MSALDAGFLYAERPHAPLHIGALAVLEGTLARDALIERIERRLPRLRRYGQRAMPVPLGAGHPSWEDDPGFAARSHVQRWALPAPGGEGELSEMCAELLAQRLDRSRPLWEMHVIEGLAGGRSAIFQKVHHCMIDGVSGAQLLEEILDRPEGEAPWSEPLGRVPPAPGPLARWRSAVGDTLRRQASGLAGVLSAVAEPARARQATERLLDGAWSALGLAARDLPQLPWNTRIGARRRLAFTFLPMDGVKRIRTARGGTVNDVVLCVLAGGLRRYLSSIGLRPDLLEPTALVPVSLRAVDESRTLGNRISAMIVPLAVDVGNEPARLLATRAVTGVLRDSASWNGIDALLRMLDGVPAPLTALAGRALPLGRIANVVATNVPGPREARALCGHPLEALYPVVPITDGIGLGLAVFSYAGRLFVGLNADAGLVPDLDKLRLGIEESFAALLAGT